VKYTPNGGKIKLSISEKATNQNKVGAYEVVFEDNGIGMSPEYVEKIFEPFSRAEDHRVSKIQGTGLGMTIARNIVRMMGGDIKVESTQGKGTKFTVLMFLELQDEEKPNYEKFIDLPILVADDDKVCCEAACNILDEIGMKSEGVLTGGEAVTRVEQRHAMEDDFFAVILDWQMPEMDGVETARRIRAIMGDEIPIIILSAFDWEDIEQEARRAGVNAFISKPLFKSRMVNLFQTLMGDVHPEDKTAPLIEFEKIDMKGKRVLLVEDNELNAEIATEILQMTGIEVEQARNGAEAVDRFMEIPDDYYDIVLMDIQMPVMNGYEATRAIRALDRAYAKAVPIIAMTANAFAEDVHAAKSAGMNAHISKPLDLDVLARILTKWLG
jgi:CheY-like chemotaxis protein/anti-sigma regulatory factor (Ser/Thr protein kinase)